MNSILVPGSAQDFTPFAQQIKQQRPTCCSSPGPGPPRPQCGGPSTSRASSRASTRSSRARPAGLVPDVRAGREQDLVPLALRLERAEEQGQRLARRVHAKARPGAGPLHAGRVRRGPDDRAGHLEGLADRRRADDLGARGLELHGPEGPADDPRLGPRDAPADVPGQAGRGERRSSRRRDEVAARPYTAPPERSSRRPPGRDRGHRGADPRHP